MEIELKEQFIYRVQKESEQDICNKFNSDKHRIVRNNTSYPFFNGEWVQINVNDYVTHFVKPTQTLEDIAKIYNTSCEKILLDNNLASSKLFIGQRLKIYK